ncbi:A-kinase anchor protein 1, mitochondrial [Araneus ventricosus]|uniref:A-kinase anchor protein 1, mitochondrial n=1 Tax=Araneus ventricosus TaxID=182803 RepID=A0A4Y2EFF6_ARAVE|nr:A-kinase anchor protein 1, mitochondrial [Araneus ventricosus]
MSILARNVLICAVPTVIVLLSVFWFRRKKKIKSVSVSETNEQTFSSEDYDLRLNHSGEITSDAADTLSDASSFASPQSSEKSIRTKSIQLMSSPKDDTTGSSNISNILPVTLSNCQKADSYEMDSCVEPNLLYKTKDIQFSDVLNNDVHNNVESVNSDFNIESENKNSVYDDTIKVSKVTKEYKEESVPVKVECNEHEITKDNEIVEKSEIKNFHSSQDTAELMRILEINFHQNNKCKIERDSLRSNESNESVISSQGGDIEKLQAAETESNDSHSSVLDENSLSYISDDSEYRHLVELKNKDSLSSVLDENSALSSFCEDSEKSINAESPVAAIKSDVDAANNDSIPVDNTDIDLTLTLVKDTIDQCANLLESLTVADTEAVDSLENQCSNSVEVDCSVQNLETCLSETRDSTDSNSQNLLIESTDKLPELDSSVSNQRHQTTLISSNEALESCDSCTSESNLNSSSDEKPSAPVLDSISKDSPDQPSLENPCSSLPDNSDEFNHVSAVENENHSRAMPAANENPEIDPQIPAMDIQGLLNNQAAAVVEVADVDLNPAAWQVQDTQNDILNGHQDEEVNAVEGKEDENPDNHFVYEFELPQELCGRLIGKHGKHVKSIKDRSHTNVYIKRHPYNQQLKLVVVEGNRADVTEALDIIRRKYPPSRYPMVTLVRTNVLTPPPNVLPESLQLHLPEGASCDVILSSLVSAGHFFLQQPTHPTYPSLSTLDQCMINCYSQLDTPLLPHPVEPGVICAAPVLRGWYRAQVIHVYENDVDCELKFVDYGGFSTSPISSLRQIRSDFMSLPFQASECYLAGVRPVDSSDVWSAEATATFEELAQGQILQALLVDYAPDGIPMVNLYRVQGITNMFINKELVERGLAVWVDNNHWDPH